MKKILFLISTLLAVSSLKGLTIGVDAGVNITNDGSALLPYVPQITGQDPNDIWDWIADGSPPAPTDFEPGQIAAYNTITSSSLPQPPPTSLTGTPPTTYLQDDNGSGNGGYMFAAGTYYVVGHWGQANAAFYLTVSDPTEKYSMVSSVHQLEGSNLNSTDPNAFQGHLSKWTPPKGSKPGNWKHTGGGYSNLRAWQVSKIEVPDSGSTLILLGLALSLFGFMRRKLR